jgi:hypothetical protein
MADENRFGEIVSKCWYDAAFKKRFMSEPKKVLAEFGMPVPEGLDVKVVENTNDTMYLTIPPAPSKPKGGELSDNQLDAVSGGVLTSGATVTATRPQYYNITKAIIVATSTGLTTCSTGKECVPH